METFMAASIHGSTSRSFRHSYPAGPFTEPVKEELTVSGKTQLTLLLYLY